MNILVIGGDGFCGWPVSLRLANHHNVIIVDDLSRREIDEKYKIQSLVPINTLHTRSSKSGIKHIVMNACEHERLTNIIRSNCIDVVVHLGEIRSAPYSMMNADTMTETVSNNSSVTMSVLTSIVESGRDVHLVHMGTMGVYGYNDIFGEIPEGYLDVIVNNTQRPTKILYPTDPGSIYHMTKSIDQIMFQYFNKNWGVRVTDLHQGIVWGVETKETSLPGLANRFDYDHIYGTVLNRMIAQASVGHPLTVYGSGEQTRAFINIEDTVSSIEHVVNHPPNNSRVEIINQFSETKSVLEIATMISEFTGVPIAFVDNPRNESIRNNLTASNQTLSQAKSMVKLETSLLEDIKLISDNYSSRINTTLIDPTIRWVR